MPLRVLLLLPQGEQPSVSRTTGHKPTSKPPKSPTNRSFKTPPSPLSGIPSRLSNEYRSKPLPSPPPFNVNAANRASNQTHLTLPSTSGSSAGSSSRSTEYVPSPPLSPDPTTAFFASPTADSFADVTVRGLKLNPNKSNNRVKPVLRLNTKLPRTGKGLRYISSSARDHSASEEEEDEGEGEKDGVGSLEMRIHASTSRSDDNGAATARKAVDDRLQHLLATTAENLHRISRMGRNSNVPSSPLPHSPLDHPFAQHPAFHQSIPPKIHPGLSRRKQDRKRPLRDSKPPSAPIRALPPYKIFGPHDVVPLDVISDLRRAKKIPIRSGGWVRTGVLIQSTRPLKPKGAKGKYIRLVTLPPLPIAKVVTKVEAWDECLDELDITASARDSGRRKGKGRMPTVLVDEEEDSGENIDGKSNTPRREKEVPTVYMTELVSNLWERPVPCMMWPPPPLPPPSSSASRSSSRHTSITSTRPTSTLSRLSTSISFNKATSSSPPPSTQILTPQTSAYQLPLPTLTPLQKSSLHTAGILVYAVPKSYTGSVPPPECVRVGEELVVREEELVGPWAMAQIPTLHSLQTSGEPGSGGDGGGVSGSPRGSMFGLTSPARSPLSVNVFTANGNGGGGAGGGGALSASLSPRWPIEGLGLWSRAKAGESRRGSAASVMSGVESPAHSRPTSGVMPNVVEVQRDDGAEGHATSAGGWSSSFSSIRARAQGYYAKDASASPIPTIPSMDASLSTSKSEVLSTEASSVSMSRGSSNTIGTSRSFGSLFVRTTSSSTNTGSSTPSGDAAPSSGVTPSTARLTVPDSGYASSPGTGGGDVLFDYVEPPRDGEVVKVEIVETESGVGNAGGNAPAKTGWKLGGWGARWGS